MKTSIDGLSHLMFLEWIRIRIHNWSKST